MVLRSSRSCKRNNFASDLSVRSELWEPRCAASRELTQSMGTRTLAALGKSKVVTLQHLSGTTDTRERLLAP